MLPRRHLVALTLGLAAGACSAPPEPTVTTLLTNLTIIDGTGAPPLSDGAIALAGDRIRYAGPAASAPRAPEGATVRDMDGQWIMPGLIDTHAHIDQGRYAPRFLAQLVAFGTTSLRAPSNPVTDLRARVRSGELVGPDMHLSGVLINGPEAFYGQRGETDQDYRDIVSRDADIGVEFVKVYAGLTPHLTRVVIEEASAHGIRVVGHLGETSWTEAAQAGIHSISHAWYSGLIDDVVPVEFRTEFDGFYIPPGTSGFDADLFQRWIEVVDVSGPEVIELAQVLVENGVTVDPTLALGEAMTWGNDPAVLERLEPDLAMPGQAQDWRGGPFPWSSGWSGEQFAAAQTAWPLMQEIVRVLHARGVVLTTGTDVLNPWMTPGVSLHRELELFVDAGIPPLEVLTIGTYNGAVALGIEHETGSVEHGKRADLLVLDADPTASIANTRRITSVFLAGVEYSPSELLQVPPDPADSGGNGGG